MAVTALIALQQYDFDKVHFLLPTRHLQHREQLEFGPFWSDLLHTHVMYHTSLENLNVAETDLLIVDEVDTFVYEQAELFFQKANATNTTVCFTATKGRQAEYLERMVYKPMGIKIFDYWPASMPEQ